MSADSNLPSSSTIDDGALNVSSGEDHAKVDSVSSLGGDGLDQKYGARAMVGGGMHKFTELINDNIVAARFGVFATIALLTAYGISRTPLLFRYRTVAEVPRSYFVGRRRLYCRIIGVQRNAKNNYSAEGNDKESIQVLVRHLSPIGALLPTSWFESLMRISPSNRNFSPGLKNNAAQGSSRELLRLQIAGILPPPLIRDSFDPEDFLERLAKKRTLVSCQLLGRSVVMPEEGQVDSDRQKIRQLGSETNGDATNFPSDFENYQVALCRLSYRPGWQLFSTDIAEALVKEGNANVASTILNHSTSSYDAGSLDDASAGSYITKITDTSQRVQDIRRDVKYLDGLGTVEFEAAQKSKGMWSVPEIRQMKKEIVDEVDFQAKANPLQKIWRMIRGG